MVTQSKKPSAKGSFSAFTCAQAHVAHQAFVEHAVAPARQHLAVDVRQHDEPALADLLRQAHCQIAGAAGDVQRPLPRMQVGQPQREALPQPVHASRT